MKKYSASVQNYKKWRTSLFSDSRVNSRSFRPTVKKRRRSDNRFEKHESYSDTSDAYEELMTSTIPSYNLNIGNSTDKDVLSGFYEHYSVDAEEALEIECLPEENFESYSDYELEDFSESSNDSEASENSYDSGSSNDESDFAFNTKTSNVFQSGINDIRCFIDDYWVLYYQTSDTQRSG